MEDIRLKHMPFEFDGKEYILTCNMNVLADVQEEYHGNLMAALRNPGSLHAATSFLAAMLNDYADDMGWDKRWTPRQVGRKMGADPQSVSVLTQKVARFVRESLTAKPAGEDAEKN